MSKSMFFLTPDDMIAYEEKAQSYEPKQHILESFNFLRFLDHSQLAYLLPIFIYKDGDEETIIDGRTISACEKQGMIFMNNFVVEPRADAPPVTTIEFYVSSNSSVPVTEEFMIPEGTSKFDVIIDSKTGELQVCNYFDVEETDFYNHKVLRVKPGLMEVTI